MVADDLTRGLRALQVTWAWLFGGLLLAALVAVIGPALWQAPMRDSAPLLFYTNACVNLGATVWVFAAQHRLGAALRRQADPHVRLALMHEHARRALVPLIAAGLFAALATLGSGQRINLAFLATTFGYAALFFPSGRRMTRTLGLSQTLSDPQPVRQSDDF